MNRSEGREQRGYIHSIESFGTVDGPGIRLVIFFQGCPLRCCYCHNPDTWRERTGRVVSTEEILEQYRRNRQFYAGGGITATGGEPTLQIGFLTALFHQAKEEGIHTCLDTSGAMYDKNRPEVCKAYDVLMRYTDLIMLDIKHIDPQKHREMTGQGNENILDFARYLDGLRKDIWIRHVVVPGLTDDAASLERLGKMIAELRSVKAIDVLPYHTMGKRKYKEMGMPYPLEATQSLTEDELTDAREKILSAYRRARERIKRNE